MRQVVIGHTLFTIAMFGLMWTVQTVVYPQFRSVPPSEFAAYASDHSTRIVTALVLLAPAEIIFAAWLWLDTPSSLNRGAVFVAGLLLAIGWITTAAWFGPLHARFDGDYDLSRINQLISTNWLRTGIWTVRAGLACWFLWDALDSNSVPS